MKTIRNITRIARIELGNLFYSPIAWVTLVIFAIQAGIAFADRLEDIIRYRQYAWQAVNLTVVLYTRLVPDFLGFLPTIQAQLFFYIPLVAMGLISRELGSGSIKLLQSSPITSKEIVAGKFLSMMIFGLMLVLILMLFVAAGSYAITQIDIGLVLSGLIGLYLLLCVYAAIGLFVSSLTASQVIAAIGTLVLLAVLNYIDVIGQKAGSLRNLIYFFQITRRTNQFTVGLVSTKNIAYFILVIVFFLGLTMLGLENKKSSRPLPVRVSKYLTLAGVCLFLGYVTSLPGMIGYWDLTANQSQTLSKNALEILKKIHGPLQIHTYVNILGPYSHLGIPEKVSEDKELFEKYQRFKPDISIDYVYYYDSSKSGWLFHEFPGRTTRQIAIKVARSTGFDYNKLVAPETLRGKIDLRPEENQFVRQLQTGDKKTFLRVYEWSTSYKEKSEQPSENEVSNALKRLEQRSPKIAFLAGNGERRTDKAGDKGYYHATTSVDCRGALINRGFDVLTISPDTAEIPGDLAALVVADPVNSFAAGQLARLFRYVDNGGNLLVAAEPGGQAIVNPLLQHFGVSVKEGRLLQQGGQIAPDFIMTGFSDGGETVSKLFPEFRKNGDSVVFPGAVALECLGGMGYALDTVLLTNVNTTWNSQARGDKDTGLIRYDPANADTKKTWPVALALTRNRNGRRQRIMIVGDGDFLTEEEMERDDVDGIRTRDLDFAAETFKWFTYGQFPVDADHADIHHSYRIGMKGVGMLRLLFLGVLPGFLLLFAIIFLLKRKKR